MIALARRSTKKELIRKEVLVAETVKEEWEENSKVHPSLNSIRTQWSLKRDFKKLSQVPKVEDNNSWIKKNLKIWKRVIKEMMQEEEESLTREELDLGQHPDITCTEEFLQPEVKWLLSRLERRTHWAELKDRKLISESIGTQLITKHFNAKECNNIIV